MRIPNLDEIRKEKETRPGRVSSYARLMHPNPRFYKYFWWVFWSGSPVDGREFLTEPYQLSTVAASAFLKELKEQGECVWLYNKRLPRLDPQNPFDVDHPRWDYLGWAPAYDDDPDPATGAPTSGHK